MSMTRFVGVATIALAAIAGPIGAGARGQTPQELRATAKYVEAFQNKDGGFAAKVGGASSLGATSSAIRTLGYVGGANGNVPGSIAYVESCFDKASGGFAPTPGGKPDEGTTASGLMAVAALKVDLAPYVGPASAFLAANAKSFEDVRIAVAGLEAVKAKPPAEVADRWLAIVSEGKNADGTFGTGPTRAKETGGRAVALLRMGREPEGRDAILAALRSDQGPDGGWSADGKASDLGTSYRIMRCFFMMKAKPDLARLRSWLATYRQSDGGYASTVNGPADPGGTYFCGVMLYWARLLDGEPAIIETIGFRPMVKEGTLDGWEGDTNLWSVKGGTIVGKSPGIKANDFLATTESYGDFVLQLNFRLVGDPGCNSGVMFRSARLPGHEMTGYQADIGQNFWGGLYDESRRNKVLVPGSERSIASVREGGWNHYEIRALGNHVTLTLNGVTSVDYREPDAAIARDGKIALQIHSGGPMTVEFKDILIQPLPRPKVDDPEAKSADNAPGFHLRTLASPAGPRLYTVYLPRDYDQDKTYPAVLFLHGSGERGTDGVCSAQIGLGAAILANPAEFPAIVVMPQARETWTAGSADADAALAALDAVTRAHKVDPDRIAITGLSMGGRGAWEVAAANPGRFSAVAPVCGMGKPESAATLANLPTWVVCGDEDRIQTLHNARAMTNALKAAGGSPRLTEYRSVPHNSWDRAYNDLELIDWLLSRRRQARPDRGE